MVNCSPVEVRHETKSCFQVFFRANKEAVCANKSEAVQYVE